MKWDEAYNCYSASVAKGAIKLSFSYKSGSRNNPDAPHGYEVNVNGRRLQNLFRNVDDAKVAAIKLALKIANEAIEELTAND
jgi:hypothetical protein